MNGVIHNCSHGAGTDVNTRMTEVRLSRAARRCDVDLRTCVCVPSYVASDRVVVCRTR